MASAAVTGLDTVHCLERRQPALLGSYAAATWELLGDYMRRGRGDILATPPAAGGQLSGRRTPGRDAEQCAESRHPQEPPMDEPYLMIIERTPHDGNGDPPDRPWRVATDRTGAETLSAMREVIAFHLEGLCLAGRLIPLPTGHAEYLTVSALHPTIRGGGDRRTRPARHSWQDRMRDKHDPRGDGWGPYPSYFSVTRE